MNLLVITAAFPYGLGESFIENEIDFLSKNFETIYLLPKTTLNSEARIVPQNCKVIPLSEVKQGRLNFSSHFFLFRIFVLEFLKNLLKPTRISGVLKFFKITWMHIRNIETVIEENKIEPRETICYSYWLTYDSLAGGIINKSTPFHKVIARAHRFDLYEELSVLGFHPFKKSLVKLLDKIYPVSDNGVQYLKKKYPNKSSDVEISRLGVPPKEEKPEKKSNKFKILSCSGLRPVKRVSLIALALKVLSDEIKTEIEWIHIGDGDLKEREKVFSIAKGFPSNFNFKFLGQMTNKEVIQFYSGEYIDCFINTSESEGVPVSIMEAQSFGVPVIATNVGGVSEIVNDKLGKLLNANPSSEEIASVLKLMILSEKRDLELKRKKALTNWDMNYNSEKNYSKFINKILNE